MVSDLTNPTNIFPACFHHFCSIQDRNLLK
nr:MAG TPA: hypothetical protein [Caudoviricetes sp.]